MIITILTMFPEMFDSFLASPIPKRAVDRGLAAIRLIDIKEYAGGSFRHIDDSTFGGGAGMVLRAGPVLKALKAAFSETSPANSAAIQNTTFSKCPPAGPALLQETASSADRSPARTRIAALTPAGSLYSQWTAERYRSLDHLVLICGHYEGMDERIYSHVDDRISIGDYILSGGETAAMVVMDSVLRLLPGVLRKESTEGESFTPALHGLLEYPQYTRPADLYGDRVPEVLLSGNHEEIRRWRLEKSLETTLDLRPELLIDHSFSEKELLILQHLANKADLTEKQRLILKKVLSDPHAASGF